MHHPSQHVAIMGLSGVGKTTLARRLDANEWFHYAVDYRIWTHYLGDELNDYLKQLAMEHPVLADLLRRDAISIDHRVHFDNLFATSVFMGMLGDPKQFGSTEKDFARRMARHASAEIAALKDIPYFIERAHRLYGYEHLLADMSGSLCEIIDPDDPHDPVIDVITAHCTLLYIQATKEHEAELLRRAAIDPKPIYYRPDFIRDTMPGLLQHWRAASVEEIDPAEVSRYLYPRLLEHRVKRYEAIADQHAITLTMDEVHSIRDQDDLSRMIVLKTQ